MNFIQFATNNVKRNTKSYLGYFLSILISSTLLFSFIMFINHPDLDTSLFANYIIAAMKLTLELQEGAVWQFQTLYISEVQNLYVCDVATLSYKQYPISEELCKKFFINSI